LFCRAIHGDILDFRARVLATRAACGSRRGRHRLTLAPPLERSGGQPPPRGHDVAKGRPAFAGGRRSLSGARRLCCHRVARVVDPRWRYFGRQLDAHACFGFSMRRFSAAIRPTPFTGVNHRPSGREPCLACDANPRRRLCLSPPLDAATRNPWSLWRDPVRVTAPRLPA